MFTVVKVLETTGFDYEHDFVAFLSCNNDYDIFSNSHNLVNRSTATRFDLREGSLFIGRTGSCKKRRGLVFFWLKNAGS